MGVFLGRVFFYGVVFGKRSPSLSVGVVFVLVLVGLEDICKICESDDFWPLVSWSVRGIGRRGGGSLTRKFLEGSLLVFV